MKTVWVKAVPFDKGIIAAALESGADAVVVPEGCTTKVKEIGLIATVSEDGDLRLGADVVEVEINSKADEERALALSRDRKVIVRTNDWTIIPLENLIAQTRGLIAEVATASEAATAVGVLEVGVDGVLLTSTDPEEIRETVRAVKTSAERLELGAATITSLRPLGLGDRVCLDTCTNMTLGQGMLVGNSSQAMFLVHSESVENPYVAARPFRVNAGPVHAYVRVPGGRTRYLSELRAGDEALIVNCEGNTMLAYIGRSKTERRPLILVQAECGGTPVSLVLQNAETIRLTRPGGEPVAVVSLKPGDEVLAHVEEAGRHFGVKVKETITEH